MHCSTASLLEGEGATEEERVVLLLDSTLPPLDPALAPSDPPFHTRESHSHWQIRSGSPIALAAGCGLATVKSRPRVSACACAGGDAVGRMGDRLGQQIDRGGIEVEGRADPPQLGIWGGMLSDLASMRPVPSSGEVRWPDPPWLPHRYCDTLNFRLTYTK